MFSGTLKKKFSGMFTLLFYHQMKGDGDLGSKVPKCVFLYIELDGYKNQNFIIFFTSKSLILLEI